MAARGGLAFGLLAQDREQTVIERAARGLAGHRRGGELGRFGVFRGLVWGLLAQERAHRIVDRIGFGARGGFGLRLRLGLRLGLRLRFGLRLGQVFHLRLPDLGLLLRLLRRLPILRLRRERGLDRGRRERLRAGLEPDLAAGRTLHIAPRLRDHAGLDFVLCPAVRADQPHANSTSRPLIAILAIQFHLL